MKTPLALMALFLLSLPSHAQDAELEMLGIPSEERSIPPMQGSDLFQGQQDQAKKFYSSGGIAFADVLPLEGFGFVKLYHPRNRGYGSFDLVEILKDAAAKLQTAFPSRDRVMIGDMSAEHGGYISGHASHQNGLDADIAFIRLDQTEQDPQDTRGFEESFVKNGKMTENFDFPRNWAYSKILIATGRVQRIFVGAVVKKAFCNWAKAVGELETERETLKRLRTISGHTDHFHVRITCPRNSTSCKPQEDMSEDTGC
jgi:penicillin-insensitive murein DD-endopeptidase